VDLTAGGRRFSDLCRDLYALAQGASHDAAGLRGPERGWSWEARVADALSRRGFPVEPLPGGVRVFGAVPASGLRHQTDAALHCTDAHVVGECKSYSGRGPQERAPALQGRNRRPVRHAVGPPPPPNRSYGCSEWQATRHHSCGGTRRATASL
jgi:hypothetical protein